MNLVSLVMALLLQEANEYSKLVFVLPHGGFFVEVGSSYAVGRPEIVNDAWIPIFWQY